ncbi:MAG: uracil-DNA glycosylase [Euryarchaeota archaeon]|nr:uracil-DNA glycosylase [Euryarchaeota archaeon]MBE49942.1 uracil-DNA glycosylase [Flammeovirgaceae bacterium]
MEVKIEKSWKKVLNNEFKKEYFNSLVSFLKDEYKNKIIYPPGRRIFSSFNFCPFDKVKVVIIGQDPYHGINQANGLCFSVNKDVKIPPSLFNIFKELKYDIGIDIPKDGNLERWAIQGVLLLNSILTVRKNCPGSHSKKGWENFTDEVISILSKNKNNLVFLLWGNYAKSKLKIIDQNNHFILTSSHPSPFSANNGFFNSFHFSQTNSYLKKNKIKEIKW